MWDVNLKEKVVILALEHTHIHSRAHTHIYIYYTLLILVQYGHNKVALMWLKTARPEQNDLYSHMMTSSNRNIFRVTGFCAANNSPHKGQWRGPLMFSFICVSINGWVNNHEAGDLRRYRAHYEVTIMTRRSSMVTQVHYATTWLMIY